MSCACRAALTFFFPVGFMRSPTICGPAFPPICTVELYEQMNVSTERQLAELSPLSCGALVESVEFRGSAVFFAPISAMFLNSARFPESSAAFPLSTAPIIAEMWSGVVPQQPPRRSAPENLFLSWLCANSPARAGNTAFPFTTVGIPAFGWTRTGVWL